MIPYLTANQTPDYATANLVVQAVRAKFRAMLSGKAPALKYFVTGSSTIGGLTTYSGGIPAELLGKCFFFSGAAPAVYSYLFPGFIGVDVTVDDPILGPTVVTRARPYDHTPFDAAAAALAQVSVDAGDKILTVEDAGDAYYTNGLRRQNGISLFDHSLNAHGRLVGGVKYYLKEANRPVPEKMYDWAVAELVIEGTSLVALPADAQYGTAVATKFRFLRFWNLQAASCVVPALGLTLAPFTCTAVRRDWNATTRRFEDVVAADYFWDFQSGDPRGFAAFAHQPSNVAASVPSVVATTPAGAMQGNNIVNFSVLADWVREFSGSGFAQFIPDVHELCDVGRTAPAAVAAKFKGVRADTGELYDDAVLGDLVYHTGTLRIAKVHGTDQAPAPNEEYKREAWDTVEFVGFRSLETLRETFAAKGITLAFDGGDVTLVRAGTEWSLDLIHKSTNLLRDPAFGGEARWYVLRNGANIDTAFTIDRAVLESGSSFQQDATGHMPFTLGNYSTYKILQRTLGTTTRSRAHISAATGAQVITSGEAERILFEQPQTYNETLNLYTPCSHLLALTPFGNPALASQDDEHVRYENSRLTLTPAGWVLTFVESVRGDVLPVFKNTVRHYTGSGITLAGLQIAGTGAGSFQLYEGDRVAVNAPGKYGLWIVSSQAWVRALDTIPDGYRVRVTDGERQPGGVKDEAFTWSESLGRWESAGFDDGTTGTMEYVNSFGSRFALNTSTGRFEHKHCIRFRKLGWPWHQAGRIHCAFQSPFHARNQGGTFGQEISGPDGADFTNPGAAGATGIAVLRSLGMEDLKTSGLAGARIWGVPPAWPLDSLVAIERKFAVPYWYQTPEPFVNSPTPRDRVVWDRYDNGETAGFYRGCDRPGNQWTYMPLTAIHYNHIAMIVNQLKQATPLDWRCLRFAHGARVLNMADLKHWSAVFGATTPAPMEALAGLPNGHADAARWQDFFGGYDIAMATAADGLPVSWQTYRTQGSEQRTYTVSISVKMSNAAYADTTVSYHPDLANGWWYWNFTADVAMTAGGWTWGAPVVVNVGKAYLGVGEVANPGHRVSVPEVPGVNLTTAYAGATWLTVEMLQTFLSTLGMTLENHEPFLPLVLERIGFPAEWESVPAWPDVTTAASGVRVMSIEMARSTSPEPMYSSAQTRLWPKPVSEPTDGGLNGAYGYTTNYLLAQGVIASLNLWPAGTAIKTGTVVTSAPVFRLAESGEAPQWKIAVDAAPPATWHREGRTEGRFPLMVSFEVGWLVFNSTGDSLVQYAGRALRLGTQVGPRLYQVHYEFGQTGLTSVPVTTSSPTDLTLPANAVAMVSAHAAQRTPALLQALVATRDAAWPFALNGPTINQPAPAQVYGVGAGGYVQSYAQDLRSPVRVTATVPIPVTEQAKESADRMAAWLWGERRWVALHVVGEASVTCHGIGVPDWGLEEDWWLRSAADVRAWLFGAAQGYAPALDQAAVGVSEVTATEGVTLLRPDPGQALRWFCSRAALSLP